MFVWERDIQSSQSVIAKKLTEPTTYLHDLCTYVHAGKPHVGITVHDELIVIPITLIFVPGSMDRDRKHPMPHAIPCHP